jgi:hypothetical protein
MAAVRPGLGWTLPPGAVQARGTHMRRIGGCDLGRVVHACRKAGDRPGSALAASLTRCGAVVRLGVDRLATVGRVSRVIGALGRDGGNDALHRLVPAFYDAY